MIQQTGLMYDVLNPINRKTLTLTSKIIRCLTEQNNNKWGALHLGALHLSALQLYTVETLVKVINSIFFYQSY